jgi:hypothetical protein
LFIIFPQAVAAFANNASMRKSAFISVHPRFLLNSQEDLPAGAHHDSRMNRFFMLCFFGSSGI